MISHLSITKSVKKFSIYLLQDCIDLFIYLNLQKYIKQKYILDNKANIEGNKIHKMKEAYFSFILHYYNICLYYFIGSRTVSINETMCMKSCKCIFVHLLVCLYAVYLNILLTYFIYFLIQLKDIRSPAHELCFALAQRTTARVQKNRI